MTEFILAAGDEAQKLAWLTGLACGEVIGAFAGADRAGEVVEFDCGRLTGRVALVTHGQQATVFIVRAGRTLALVESVAREVAVVPRTGLDRGRGMADVVFTGAEPVAFPGVQDVDALIDQVTQRVAVLVSFEQLGGADRALGMARDHALERKAFGRSIGSRRLVPGHAKRSPALRIEAGSHEILRNIIAERVLGLPGDIRIDKDLPFNRLSK